MASPLEQQAALQATGHRHVSAAVDLEDRSGPAAQAMALYWQGIAALEQAMAVPVPEHDRCAGRLPRGASS
jgi:hypothetical protein